MSQFEAVLGTTDPQVLAIARHLRISTDFPEPNSEGSVLVSQGPDLPAKFLPTSTIPASVHVLATTAGLGSQHTVSGLTAGQVLRATGATTAAFQALTAADLPPHNHDASQITTGVFTRAVLPPQVAYEDEANTFTLTQAFGAAGVPFTVVGTGLVTNLNADRLDSQDGSFYLDLGNATGVLARARLPSQIAYEDEANTFTLLNMFTSAGDPALGFSGGAAGATTWIYATDAGGVARFRLQRDGKIHADELLLHSGDVNSGPTNISLSGATGVGTFGTSVITYALYSPAASALNLGDAGNNRWQITTGGHIIALADATYDFGAAGFRPRNLFMTGQLGIGVAPPVGFADISIGRAGRIDMRLYDSTAAVDERITDLFSLDGIGGAQSLAVGITRADLGTAGHLALRLLRLGNTWTTAQIMQSGGVVIIGTDPGGPELLRVGGAARFTTGVTIQRSNADPALTQRRFGTATNGNILGGLDFLGPDSAANDQYYARIRAQSNVVTDGAEEGMLRFIVTKAGVETGVAELTGGSATFYTSITTTGSGAALILDNRTTPGTNSWFIYNQDGSALTFYRSGQNYLLLSTAALYPNTAGLLTLGTSANRWGKLWGQDADFSSNVNIATTATYQIGGVARLGHNSGGGPYTTLSDPTGATRIWIGSGSDFGMYFNAPIMYFRTLAGVDFFRAAQGNCVTVSGTDITIGDLGRFDSTDIPLDSQLLVYHAGAVNKWQAEAIQFSYNAGDAAVGLLADNTSTQFLYYDPGAGADSPVGAPPAPVLQLFAFHKGVTVGAYASTGPDIFYHDGPAYPADFRHFIYEYSTDNFGTAAKSLCTASSDKVNHGRLTPGTTYYYRARAVDRAGNASANSAVVSFVAVASSDTSNFGVVLANEIAVDRLAALSANVGIITAGQIRNAANTTGMNIGGVGGIPGTWTSGINLETGTGLGSMTRYLNLGGTGTFLKHDRLEMNYDGSVKMYQTSSQPLFKLDATDFLIQNDAVTPTQGLLVDGTLPASWTRYLNLNGVGAMLKHDRLSLNYDGTATFNGLVSIDIDVVTTGFQFTDAGVAHGMTAIAPTNVFGTFSEGVNDSGGFVMSGFSEAATICGLLLEGKMVTAGLAFSQAAAVAVFGTKKSGTGEVKLADTEYLFSIGNGPHGGFDLKFAMSGYGQMGSVDGAAATPAWTFMNDLNTGLFRSNTDEICVAAGGAAVVKLGVTGILSKVGQTSTFAKPALVLDSNGAVSSSSTAFIAAASYTIPANTLADGQCLSIFACGVARTQQAQIQITLAGVVVFNSGNLGVDYVWWVHCMISRATLNTYNAVTRWSMGGSGGAIVDTVNRKAPENTSITWSNANTLNLEMKTNAAGGTITLDAVYTTLNIE